MLSRACWISVLAVAACTAAPATKNGSGEEAKVENKSMPVVASDRDATERGILALGIEGAVLRVDLNSKRAGKLPVFRASKVHVLSELLLVEGSGARPKLYALQRDGLKPIWTTDLAEPSKYPAAENPDTIVIVSAHVMHAFRSFSGANALRYVGGPLNGSPRPHVTLPFAPTGGPAIQLDTAYIPSLGSPGTNKTLETFSLITGQQGWGFRTIGPLNTDAHVGGDVRDPRLYFCSSRGIVTCLNGNSYGDVPRSPRWEVRTENGVSQNMFLSPDREGQVGALFVVDNRGIVYCLDRATGQRRWLVASEAKPAGAPKVFGNLCVVPMKDGFYGFDADNVFYELTVAEGPDQGKTFVVRKGGARKLGSSGDDNFRVSDRRVSKSQLVFRVEGEVLTVAGKNFAVNGRSSPRASVVNGDRIQLGSTVLTVSDRGDAPLWKAKKYADIVARVGDSLIAQGEGGFYVLDADTGEKTAGPVSIPDVRIVPTNTDDGNVYFVAGEGRIYALFPR